MKDKNATVIVDISQSEDEILKNLQKDARWGIRKAEREGLIVEESNDWNGFYEIYLQTMMNAGVKPETLEHVRRHADVLLICKMNGEKIGGSCLEVVGGMPKLTRNGSLKEFQQYQPNNLLYWHCILWSKKRGFKKLDLGGWQINAKGHAEGVNKFKERWGEVVYKEEDYPLYKAIGRKLVRKSGLARTISRKLRRRTE